MKKYKLALIGCGYLNEIVANALNAGMLPEYELIAVLGRDYDRARDFADRHGCKACADIEELVALQADFTAEAASVKAVQEYGETVLQGGSNLVVLSIGAFADRDFYERVKNTAAANERRVYIASGAVAQSVFHGTTKEGIALLPTKVNVAIATALASAGPEQTTMNISAVPGFKGDKYKIEIQGEEVSAELNIYSRTSAIAAWSVVRVLQNAVSPIVF